jgi:hypothetical protein
MSTSDVTEEWRPIPGTDGWYEASSLGRVRSWKMLGTRPTRRAREPRYLKPGKNQGYDFVTIKRSDQDHFQSVAVHCLVAEAFLGPRPKGMDVCHIDGSRDNHRIDNLRYGTRSENQMDRVEHGTSNRGERCGNSKLTEAQVLEICSKRDNLGATYKALADEYGVSVGAVTYIILGINWSWLTGRGDPDTANSTG